MADSTRLLDLVLERDVDLVLLSALFVLEPFRAFVLEAAIGWSKSHRLNERSASRGKFRVVRWPTPLRWGMP